MSFKGTIMNDNICVNVFNIQRFCIHDGPGIRTVVFLKGCPLSCKWCHNPESQSFKTELSYNSSMCINCGKCVDVCKNGCHSMKNKAHFFDRTNCNLCGNCVDACVGALELFGRKMNVVQVMETVLKDIKFYEKSGGGLTVSGGEPMAFPDFTYELLKTAKEHNIHTCIETSGFCSFTDVEKIAKYTDIFLYDYKVSDPHTHKKMTGVSNEVIIENLRKLDKLSPKIVLRCPIIPGVNDNDVHITSIAELVNSLQNIIEINILPYHTFGNDKHDLFGYQKYTEIYRVPLKNEVEEIRKKLSKICKNIKIT